MYFLPKYTHIYHLFPFLKYRATNTFFSLVLAGLVFLSRKHYYRLIQLFIFILFIDCLLVFRYNVNFILHVLILLTISRSFMRITRKKNKEKKIQDHLIDEE